MPLGPNISPGDTITPRSSNASASGPTVQSYIVASLATISQPRASTTGMRTSRFAR